MALEVPDSESVLLDEKLPVAEAEDEDEGEFVEEAVAEAQPLVEAVALEDPVVVAPPVPEALEVKERNV